MLHGNLNLTWQFYNPTNSTHVEVLKVESYVEESKEGVDELEEDKFEDQPILIRSLVLVVLPVVQKGR